MQNTTKNNSNPWLGMWGSERRTNQSPSLDTYPTSAPYKKPLESRTYLASWVGLCLAEVGEVCLTILCLQPNLLACRNPMLRFLWLLPISNIPYPRPAAATPPTHHGPLIYLWLRFFSSQLSGPINITIIIVRPWRKLIKLSFGPPPISNSHSKTIFLLWILYISNIVTGLYHQQSREGHLPIHEEQQRQKWRNQSITFLFHGNIERRRRS